MQTNLISRFCGCYYPNSGKFRVGALLADRKNNRTQGVLLQLKEVLLDNPGLSNRILHLKPDKPEIKKELRAKRGNPVNQKHYKQRFPR